MTDISVEGENLVLRVRGFSRVWSLRSVIRIPLGAVRAAAIVGNAASGVWKGIRMPGTHLPFVIVAGTYYKDGEKRFYDVRRGDRALELRLDGADFQRVTLRVRDPEAALRTVRQAAGLNG
jgi:hypothetical protein